MIGPVLPGVPPVHEPSPDWGEAGVADDLPPRVGMCRLALKVQLRMGHLHWPTGLQPDHPEGH